MEESLRAFPRQLVCVADLLPGSTGLRIELAVRVLGVAPARFQLTSSPAMEAFIGATARVSNTFDTPGPLFLISPGTMSEGCEITQDRIGTVLAPLPEPKDISFSRRPD